MISKTFGLFLLVAGATAASPRHRVGLDMTDTEKDALYAVYADTPKIPEKAVQHPQEAGRLMYRDFTNLLQRVGVKMTHDNEECKHRFGAATGGSYCNYFTADGADMGGWSGLTFNQFLAAVDEAQKTDPNAIKLLTKDHIDEFKVTEISYNNVNLFTTLGGSSGTQKKETKYFMGSSNVKSMNHSTMKSIEANVKFEVGPAEAEAGISREVNFSQAFSTAADSSKENTQTLVLDLSVPNYVYQQQIKVTYMNGNSDTISGGLYVSDKPVPYSQTVTYNEDGSVKAKKVINANK